MEGGIGNGPSDADLVARVRAGDRDAFAAIYDRYGDRLHDFCWSLLRNRDDAADATQDAFLRAVERLGQLKDPAKLRPWLYSIARNEALAKLRSRQRQVPDEDMPEVADQSAGPEAAAGQSELRELVWDAAAGLGERDRVLLDLHVRQGLDGAELAEAAGVGASHAYVLLNRLRNQVERSLGALLVARLGRDDCVELNTILAGWDGRFSALVRKRVARHVEDCDTCGERRRTAASPMALLSAVPIMAAPPELRDVVLAAFDAGGGADDGSGNGSGDASGGGSAGGSGTLLDSMRRRPVRSALLTSGAAVLAAGGIVAGITLFGSDGGVDPQSVALPDAATETATTTPAPPAGAAESPGRPPSAAMATVVPDEPTQTAEPPPPSPPPPPPPPPPEPGELAVTVTTLDLGADGGEATVELRNNGGSPLSYDAGTSAPWLALDHVTGDLAADASRPLLVSAERTDLPEGDHSAIVEVTSSAGDAAIEVLLAVERPPVFGAFFAQPTLLGIRNCPVDTAFVSVEIADESGVAGAVVSWQGPEGSGSSPMTERSGAWVSRVGPFAGLGEATWHVVATDTRGNTAQSAAQIITVVHCVE